MHGEIIGVWSETWREIWSKLSLVAEYGDDFFPDLYRELVAEPEPPEQPLPPEEFSDDGELIHQADIDARDAYEAAFEFFEKKRSDYEEAVSGGALSKMAVRSAVIGDVQTEADAVATLESAFGVVSSYGDDPFRNKYFQLVEHFLNKYSLRYDLRRPFSLHPTLPGVFARLIRELKDATDRDAALATLMREFEESVRDLKSDASTGNIKTCIQKQVNLLEALGALCPGVTGNTLGNICNQVGTWPHEKLKDAVKDIYKFTCDYPGIRHAGTPANSLREIEIRDLVAVSVVLAGFSPYLTDRINSDSIYRGY